MVLSPEERKKRRRDYNREYQRSEKYKKYKLEYNRSEKGKAINANYKKSEQGKIMVQKKRLKWQSKYWEQAIIRDSKSADMRNDRTWNEENYITEDFVKFLNEQQESKCIYCKITMKYGKGQFRDVSNGLTIQRMNNSLAHIKSNCVLCCYKCNITHTRKSHQEILDFLNVK